MGDLDAYRKKRDFGSTPEPPGVLGETGERRFVIHKHAARRLHYDLRLEHDGVLLSWAVPKGPSLGPQQRRLAVETEEHPIAYADFEGTIPAGQYGAGSVLIWDRGTWIPEGDPAQDYARGRLRFTLRGEKLRGRWNLVRIHEDDHRDHRRKERSNWLLIKSRDEFARSGAREIVDELPRSVVSGRTIEEIEEIEGIEEIEEVGELEEIGEFGEIEEVGDLAAVEASVEPVEIPIITPQLATLVERPPEGPRWVHEVKLDGYRILAYIHPTGASAMVRLCTRGGQDWSARLPELADALAKPALANTVLDGELCVIGHDGRSDFDALQRALATGQTGDLVYSVFDLPFVAGHDARGVALLERKRLLAQLLERVDVGDRVRVWKHVVGSGAEVFERACQLGVEGIISKRGDSLYEGRRSRSWLKLKCPRRLVVTVGGLTPPQGSRQHFGALLVGTTDADGHLRYRGKVGSGFSEADFEHLRPRLDSLRQSQPPFVDPPTGPEAHGVQWLTPELVVDVDYADLSARGRLRQARYKGVHAAPVTAPASRAPASAPGSANARVRLTHPNRLLYPDFPPAGLSKRDVADYVMRVAQWMLPHVRDRPLTLVRCPEGVGGECFYQKHAMPGLPASVERVKLRDSNGMEVFHAVVTDVLGLVGLVQMSVLEVHPWSSRIDEIERPDRLVFDLDPDVGLEFSRVVEAAFEVRDRLAELGLRSFVKTTGGKGLHVVVPVERRYPFGPSKEFCREFAARMADDGPERYTATPSKAARRGKIFIDYLRNGRGATSIAAYSLRAKSGAPVSTPLAWEEIGPSLAPERFDARTVPDRLAQLDRDPWAEMFELRQAIPEPPG